MFVWFACLFIVKFWNFLSTIIVFVVGVDESKLTWTRDWWRAVHTCGHPGKVDVQMKCATIPVRGISAMCCVNTIDEIVITSFKIDIHAHFRALVVLGLTPLADASFSIFLASGLQLLISGARHDDVDEALNLLGG
jgi:hypothetical protein